GLEGAEVDREPIPGDPLDHLLPESGNLGGWESTDEARGSGRRGIHGLTGIGCNLFVLWPGSARAIPPPLPGRARLSGGWSAPWRLRFPARWRTGARSWSVRY